jgi:RNA polymerase sporulation-specific sigma factor
MSLIHSAQKGDAEALETLIKDNMGLVKSIAVRFRDRYETEDLIQIGVIGLIKAIRGFSFEKETVLSTYAVPLITGEIKRFLRDDGAIKVSRELKKRGRIVLKAREKMISETGTEPTLSSLAEKCGLTREEALIALDCALPVISFSSPVGEKTVEEYIGEDNVSAITERIALHQAVNRLEKDERILVECRFFRGFSHQQTGVVMGCTQVKISRMEKKIMEKLKTLLE